MNKAELVAAVAEKTALSKKDSEKAVNAAFEAITAALVGGDKVQLAWAATPRRRKPSKFPPLPFPFSRPVRL